MDGSQSRRFVLRRLVAGATAALGAWHMPVSHAQAYPSKPVRIIVGAAPGGPSDFLARVFSDTASGALGQPLLIDNKPGASGTLAANLASKAAADGYTLMASGPSAMSVAPHLFAKLDYDPYQDFTPVTMLGAGAFVLAVHPSVPVQTLDEWVAYAKAKPGLLNYGSGGNGSSGHLCAEAFAARAGIELQHVPYKGDGLAVNDLLAGQIQLMLTAPNVALPHQKSGKLKILAVTSKERLPSWPDVPAIHERFADFEYLGWIILFAPAQTPVGVLESLAQTWQQLRMQASIKAKLDGLGMYPPERYSRRDALLAFMKAERQRTEALVKKLNITPT